MSETFRFPGAVLFTAVCLLGALVSVDGRCADVDSVVSAQTNADRAAAQSQARIDELQDSIQGMLARYRQTLADTASIDAYNNQLEQQVQSQTATISDMQSELADIEHTQRDVLPLMQRMIDTLDQFVKLDVPFALEERTRRVETLKGLMARADVSGSEKYRRILEAYQIELDYGRTLEAYEGPLVIAGQTRTVQFVRVGRVALAYQTMNGAETGYFDVNTRDWVRDDSYAHDVREALRVAKKQGAPDLLMVPIPAPKEVHS